MTRQLCKIWISTLFGLFMAVFFFAATPALCYTNSITLTKTQDLAFGSFIVGSSGTLAVSANGVRSVVSGGIVLLNVNPVAREALFTVTGDADANFTITLPANGDVSLTGPGAAMAVTNFTSNPTTTGTLTGGIQNLKVGATLTVGSNQTPGSYTGYFSVTVIYQ